MFPSNTQPIRPKLPAYFLSLLVLVGALPVKGYDRAAYKDDQQRLAAYRRELTFLKGQGRPTVRIPGPSFYLFGIGTRQKYIYREGELIEWPSLHVAKKWKVRSETLVPPSYTVWIRTTQAIIRIQEDEQGLWLEEGSKKTLLTGSFVRLPDFSGTRFPNILRTLHHDILVNIVDGRPLPNFLVYTKPWYRDGAMTAMVLQRTGNIDLIREWILAIRDPFDRNNAGREEADNLGEVLYLVSCVSDRQHPVVEAVLKAVERFRRQTFIVGSTDFGEHPVYQTKWLKFGLKSLSLEDTFIVPTVPDSYASLFWWDFKDGQVGSPFSADNARKYPYLAWARDHLTVTHDGPVGYADYPISWETEASEANYTRQAVLFPHGTLKTAAPHAWHAAEMFLMLASNPGAEH